MAQDDYPEQHGEDTSPDDQPYDEVYEDVYPKPFADMPGSLPEFPEDSTPTPPRGQRLKEAGESAAPRPKETLRPKKAPRSEPAPRARRPKTTPAPVLSRRERLKRRALLWRRKAALIGILVLLYTLFVVYMLRYVGGPQPDTGEPTPSPPFVEEIGQWPPGLLAVPHTVPALIKNELYAPREQHGYQFNGTAGETWLIVVEPQAGSPLDPAITLYAPSGEEIAAADDRASDLAAELQVTLPQTGPYRLLVRSSQGGITVGAYLLTLCNPDFCP